MTQPLKFVLVVQHHIEPFEVFREVVSAYDVAHARERYKLAYDHQTIRSRDMFSGAPKGEPQPKYTLCDIEPYEYHVHSRGARFARFRDGTNE